MSNTIDWGKIHYSSWSPETNLTGAGATPSFSNTQSIEFDGIDDYFDSSTTYSELDGATALTISFWAKSTLSVASNPIHLNTGSNIHFRITFSSAGRITFKKNTNADNTGIRADSGTPHDGNWNHIMICMDLSASTKGYIFFNGNNITHSVTLDTNPIQTSTGNLYLNETNKDFTGNIDEVAIWSGTDLRNDVSTIYNSGVPNNLNDNGLTAPTTWYRFEGTGTTATDSGTGGNDGTLINGVVRSTDVPT